MTAPRWANEMLFWNDCLWFHIIAAGLAAKICLWLHIDKLTIFFGVLFIAIGWEVLYDWCFGLKWWLVLKGDDRRRYAFDSIGDVLGAVIMAAIVLI
jgi:hypothetical protein